MGDRAQTVGGNPHLHEGCACLARHNQAQAEQDAERHHALVGLQANARDEPLSQAKFAEKMQAEEQGKSQDQYQQSVVRDAGNGAVISGLATIPRPLCKVKKTGATMGIGYSGKGLSLVTFLR